MPIFKSFFNSVGTWSMSYARSKSIKIANTFSLFFNFFKILSCNLRISSTVLLFFLKPDWLFDNKLFFSTNHCSLFVTSLSITLHIVDVKDIGLYESGLAAFLFGLRCGSMIAWCQSSGNSLSAINPLEVNVGIELYDALLFIRLAMSQTTPNFVWLVNSEQ